MDYELFVSHHFSSLLHVGQQEVLGFGLISVSLHNFYCLPPSTLRFPENYGLGQSLQNFVVEHLSQ